MSYFQELGESVEARWKAKSFDEAAFPEIAANALRESRPSDNVDPLEILRGFQSDWTVPQMDPIARFGQPPITVYHHPYFYIDVYYWLDGTTTIHQHAFSGAFHVLAGSSVHSQYHFDIKHRVNSSLLLGNLRLASVSHLQVGDTAEIIAGREMIHSLFHLDRPSCSVVIRTVSEAIGLPQYDYFAPHIAEAPKMRPQLMSRGKALSLLKELDPDGYRPTILSALSRATFFEAYATITQAHDADDFAVFADEFRRVHGPSVDLVVASLKETERRSKLAARRQTITNPEHRFFLAMLINVPSREEILKIVGQRFPRKPAVETLMQWISELCGPVEDAAPPLAVTFNEDELAIVEYAIRGLSLEEILARLTAEFGTAEVESQSADIGSLLEALGTSLFRPLISESTSASSRLLL